jgi:heat shock protein HslJ
MVYRLHLLISLLVLSCLLSAGCSIPVQGPENPDLTEPTWVLVSYYNGGDAFVPVPPIAEITLLFSTDGRVQGNAGCNEYFGTYRLDGGLTDIGSLASTEKYCLSPEGVMDLEQHYLSLLQETTRYNIDGDELVLSIYDTRRLLVFRKG